MTRCHRIVLSGLCSLLLMVPFSDPLYGQSTGDPEITPADPAELTNASVRRSTHATDRPAASDAVPFHSEKKHEQVPGDTSNSAVTRERARTRPPAHRDAEPDRSREGDATPVADFTLPDGADAHFSANYRRIRTRYLEFFFFGGQTATELELELTDGRAIITKENKNEKVKIAHFGDQTLHMGQALLTFAGEAHILKDKGLDPAHSEAVLKAILKGFDALDAADQEVYGASVAGFFLRDSIHSGNRQGVSEKWVIDSDRQRVAPGGTAPKSDAAMSLDQTASLFVGWWAVAKWSTDSENVAKAKVQCESVIKFLIDSKFLIRLPDGGSIPSKRGPDFRFAAGFLCEIARQVTGKDFASGAKIDVTIKGDPIRFRDDNLGEFELPGFKIPNDLPVKLSHAAVLKIGAPALVAFEAPPKAIIRFSDLFPGNDSINLPCAHMTADHPSGDTTMVVCVHMTAAHPGGHASPNVPCTHMGPAHSGGHNAPCPHMTAMHPGGHAGPHLPCTHIAQQHPHDKKTVGGIKIKIPCVHLGPAHSGGHDGPNIPCVHLGPAHPGGHNAPCLHITAQHPAGHAGPNLPCAHLTAAHPAGHGVTTPCIHIVPAHSGGHGFDLRTLDVEIPLGEKISSFARHIVLQSLAFEPTLNGVTDFLPPALASNHVWSTLLRSQTRGDLPPSLVATKAGADHSAFQDQDGPSQLTPKPWAKTNRWERCTDLEPDTGAPTAHNGIDFLSLEILMRIANTGFLSSDTVADPKAHREAVIGGDRPAATKELKPAHRNSQLERPVTERPVVERVHLDVPVLEQSEVTHPAHPEVGRAEGHDSPHVETFGTGRPRVGFISRDSFRNKQVLFAPIEGRAIFEGDIDLGSAEALDASSVSELIRRVGRIDEEAFNVPSEVKDALQTLRTSAAADATTDLNQANVDLARAAELAAQIIASGGENRPNMAAVDRLARQAPSRRSAGDEPGSTISGIILSDSSFRWPGGVIPYEIDPTLPVPERVLGAIEHWNLRTAVRLVPRGALDLNYVRFKPGSGCSSSVGMVGGPQTITLANGCPQGSVIHEIGHAVGLWHEQSRENRDDHIQIAWENIEEDMIHNFSQHITDGDDVGIYDFASIMHYPRNAFSKNGQATIIPISASAASIGQRTSLSPGDLAAIEFMYGPRVPLRSVIPVSGKASRTQP